MTTRENVAIERRIADLEGAIGACELMLIRTTLVIVGRGEEPRYASPREAIEAADLPPLLVELERRDDLQLLLHPVTGSRVLRHELDADGRAEFDAIACSARLVDVEIKCHPGQVEPITSDAPTLALTGGNRSGKSRVLAWWLFRRWALRGHGAEHDEQRGLVTAAIFWWVAPSQAYAYKYGVELLAGPNALGGGIWPDAVFAALPGVSEHELAPRLDLIDGSSIDFMHGHHSGASAGDNLVSANITDVAIDEAARIKAVENYQQCQARVSQTGGRVAMATTRKRGHWLRTMIDDLAPTSAGAIRVHSIDIFDNPWMSYAAIIKLLLSDGTYTERVAARVLAADDIAAAGREEVRTPRGRLEHLGLEENEGLLLWPRWSDEYVYPASGKQQTLWITRDGVARKLTNITSHVLARHWQRETEQGRKHECWAGTDWNHHARAVVMQLFGEGNTLAEALANQRSWHVYVLGESASTGTTQQHAATLRQRYGTMPVWCDPHGARGDEARGTEESTDIGEFRRAGFACWPAAGVDRDGRHVHIRKTDSHNVVHHLMHHGRLLVSDSCEGLLDALRHEEVTLKRSGLDSPSDLRSGYTDALKYGLWALFSAEVTAWTEKAAA